MPCVKPASCSSRNRFSRVPLSVKRTVPPQLSATASLPLPVTMVKIIRSAVSQAKKSLYPCPTGTPTFAAARRQRRDLIIAKNDQRTSPYPHCCQRQRRKDSFAPRRECFLCLRRPHFFQQRKKWGKERRQKLRFCTSSARYACSLPPALSLT